ncbi:MAG: intein-containing DNA-directed DNA polymerase, partial [Candidatus Micrarchaeota archaeon]|nr:intein-containing DNA-directed DNA polymerase [Candidatus Micrarchaeota archaeon]
MKALFVDVSYRTRGSKPVLILVFKGKKFFRIHDSSFEPYFYLHSDDLEGASKAVEQISVEDNGKLVKVKRVEKVKKTLSGKEQELLKIVCHHPSEVPVVREEVKSFGTTYEYNIPFTRRYIIDKGLVPLAMVEFEREGKELKKIVKIYDAPAVKLNTLAFDIETYNPQGAPRPAKDPALMISYAGESSGVLTTKKIDREFVHAYSNEKEMIEKFCELVKKMDVEILLGYNSSNFDLPYLKERATVLRTKLALGRDGSSFNLSRRGMINKANINGRIHVDIFHIIRFLVTIGALKTFQRTLTEVYSEITGKKKK